MQRELYSVYTPTQFLIKYLCAEAALGKVNSDVFLFNIEFNAEIEELISIC